MATQKSVGQDLANVQEAKPAVNTLKSLLKSDSIKQRFEEVLGKKANGFVSSILAISNQNKLLAVADPMTVVSAAMVAATLDLPINPSLGFAHIVPYKSGDTGKVVAQFQMGWRGYVQLAQRTGMYKFMNAGKVHEGELKSNDLLSGSIVLDSSSKTSDVVIGYFAHFETLNGFQKTVFITKDEAMRHGKRYSKSFNSGPWTKDFDTMAIKTAIKALLGKWAPLSTDYQMQKAIELDQAVIKEDGTAEYIDSGEAIPAETVETNTKQEEITTKFGE